jgi:Putative DNA-binding domain
MTLAELQERLGAAIMAPLARHDEISTQWRGEADALVKPNDRLTPLERLEIYSRSYWFRVIDCLYDDFPGLAAALGPRVFDKLVRAYLAGRPSQSFTLRNLGEGLEAWLQAHPEYAGKHFDLAIDMIRLEWAHIGAFDGEDRKPLGPGDLLEPGPDLRVGLQPYLSLLELDYPVDDLRIEASQWIEDHEEASNAPSNDRIERDRRGAARRYRRLKRRRIHLAVFRSANVVYYRRLESGEFELLGALRAGKPLQDALEGLMESVALTDEDAGALAVSAQNWFTEWARMGWLTRPAVESA